MNRKSNVLAALLASVGPACSGSALSASDVSDVGSAPQATSSAPEATSSNSLPAEKPAAVCPEVAAQCPRGCWPVTERLLVQGDQELCLGPSEVTRCYPMSSTYMGEIDLSISVLACRLSSDGTRVEMTDGFAVSDGVPLVYDGTCPENWDQLYPCSE
jgi:hypothetical protein